MPVPATSGACRLRCKIAALEASLGLVAIAAVVVAVVAPWLMARNAGLTSVRQVANPLIEKVVASARSEVLKFLSVAVEASLELQEDLLVTRVLPLDNRSAAMAQFLRCGLRVSPEMRLRYVGVGYTDGTMAVAWFDAPTRTLYLNDVGRLANGSLTHQRRLQVDNAILIELLVAIGRAIYRDGKHIGTFNVNIVLGVITEYLGTLDLSPSARVLVLTTDGVVVGNSHGEPIYTNDSRGVPQTILATELKDPMCRAVATYIMQHAGDTASPFYFTQDTSITLTVRLDDRDETVHVSIQPTTDKYGLNWTTIVSVAESDYTDTLYRVSRTALFTGIVILVGIPVVVGGLFALALRAMFKASRKMLQTEAAQMGTGMDRVVAALRRMRAESMSRNEIQETVDGVMTALSTGLFRVDLKSRQLSAEQERWIKQEFVPQDQRDSQTDSFYRRALVVDTDETGVRDEARLLSIGEWSFSALAYGPGCFIDVTTAALRRVDCLGLLGVPEKVLREFLVEIEGLYREENPYHNATHAADVTQAMVALLGGSALALSPLESVSLVLACVVHDVGHPGRNNHFQTAARTDLALLYNDASGLYREENPYHNATHAADVTQAMVALLGGSALALSPLESVSLVLACVVHDVGHPGRNNHFQTAARTDLALLYNDASVLENHHAATAFRVMRVHRLLDRLDGASYAALRKNIIGLIMATDMDQHTQVVSEFRSLTATATGGSALNTEAKFSAMKMLMKLADTSNSARSHPVVVEWARRVQEEFLAQGDEERALGLPVSAHMDRGDACLAKLQANFLKFVCVPMFQAYNDFHAIPDIMAQLAENQRYWEGQLL
eukprot:m51a1_g6301 putative high affinity camp-specific and ibmx-insensitive 3 -cyclic phosphodiesterase 8a isoform x2 (840) ;mRNA; r:296239-300568